MSFNSGPRLEAGSYSDIPDPDIFIDDLADDVTTFSTRVEAFGNVLNRGLTDNTLPKRKAGSADLRERLESILPRIKQLQEYRNLTADQIGRRKKVVDAFNEAHGKSRSVAATFQTKANEYEAQVAREEQEAAQAGMDGHFPLQAQDQMRLQLANQYEVQYQSTAAQRREDALAAVQRDFSTISEGMQFVRNQIQEHQAGIDSIADNITGVVDHGIGADRELTSARRSQRSRGKYQCILLIIMTVVLLIIILAVLS